MLEIKLSLGWRDFASLVRGESLVHKDKDVPITIKIVLAEREREALHSLIERAQAMRSGTNN